MASEVKMVVVVNMAAKMSIGRLAAQIAHAATLAILEAGEWIDNTFQIITDGDPILRYWMRENITKVVVKTWGEDQLHSLKAQAEALGIRTALMVEDDGQVTALALGPDMSEKLDPMTKELPLM